MLGRVLTPRYLWKSMWRYSTQIGYCILVLLLIWGSFIVVLSQDYKQAVQEIEQINDQFTRGLEEHVRRSLYAMDDQMQLIKIEYERSGVTPAITTLIDLARKNPLLVQILVLDSSGKIVTSVRSGEPGLNFADRTYFKAHAGANTNQVYISEPIVGRITRQSAIIMSRRINAPDGSFAGIVVMAVDPAYFSNFYKDMSFNEGRLVRIVGLDGIVRANWNSRLDEIGRNVKEGYLFSALKQSPVGRYKSVGIYYGVDRFMSYRTMTDFPLIVQVGYETKPALAEYYERRDRLMVGRIVASIVVVIVTGLAISSARRQRRKEERWKLAVEGVNDGIWDWDAADNKVFYSDRCKAILGYGPEDIGDSREEWVSRSHPDDLERVLKAIADHKEGCSAIYNETQRLLCKDGSYKWVRSRGRVVRDDSGNAIRMIGAMTDIHAEKMAAEVLRAADEELRESREKYKALIDQAFEAVILFDLKRQLIVEVNARFTEWFGFCLPEDAPLSVDKILTDEEDRQESNVERLCKYGQLQVERRTFRHKNGSVVYMERAASLVNIQGNQLAMVTYRNIADQLQREQAQRQDVKIARRIQQALLSRPSVSEHVAIETVFRSCGGDISGDLYHLEWRNDGQLLRGYLINVPGHGLTTALYTAALNVLLHEVAERDLSLPDQVQWLNKQIEQLIGETAVVAALAFEIDLQVRELRYVGAGINRFWAHTSETKGEVIVPGLNMGADYDCRYSCQTLPLSVGDHLYFSTDGLNELVDLQSELPLEDFSEMVSLLLSLPDLPACRDDATAVCIRIKSLPQTVDEAIWPKKLKLNGYGDYQRLKGTVAKVLTGVTGQAHSLQEVAVNEAIANALECRDGQARSQKALIKLNRFGNRLVVRVKTSRIGFAGNAILRRLRSHPEDMFSFGEDAAMGRGIPMMLTMSHKMTYNSDGTEVLLAWKLL